MTARPTILVELGCFGPELRASGPNSSLLEAVAALSDRFDFRVVGEAGMNEPHGRWAPFDGVDRIAVGHGIRFIPDVARILRDTPHQLLVCNGFFDHRMTLPTLLLRRTGRLKSPLLVAPRGEFSPGALDLKAGRKRVYLAALKAGGLLRGVRLQATDDDEAQLIRAALPDAQVLVGPNIRRLVPIPAFRPRSPGSPLRIAFASRIDRKKNLDWALRMLGAGTVPVRFDIHGPVSDPDYMAECAAIIATMPAHITVTVCGSTSRDEMVDLMAGYDLFLLPTRGENFGHSIADALLAGTPALIADTTPWRSLAEVHAGADLGLNEMAPWHDFIASFARLAADEVNEWRRGARAVAAAKVDNKFDIERLAACFEEAMGTGDVRN